jgi:hypothetical protein
MWRRSRRSQRTECSKADTRSTMGSLDSRGSTRANLRVVIKESLKVGIKANPKAEKLLGTSLSGNPTVSLKEASPREVSLM